MLFGNIQPGDLFGLSVQEIFIRHPASVVIEPERPMDAQLIGFLDTHPAIFFDQHRRRIGLPLIDRQAAPVFRKPRDLRIDRQDILEFDRPQVGCPLERDELQGFGRWSLRGVFEFFKILGSKGIDEDLPIAGSQLGFEFTGLVDRYGNRTVDKGELPPLRKDESELHFAALACGCQIDLGAQPDRRAVLDQSVDIKRIAILLDLPDRRSIEPQHAGGIPIRGRYRFAADLQTHKAIAARDRKFLRQGFPEPLTLESVIARLEFYRWKSVMFDDDQRAV